LGAREMHSGRAVSEALRTLPPLSSASWSGRIWRFDTERLLLAARPCCLAAGVLALWVGAAAGAGTGAGAPPPAAGLGCGALIRIGGVELTRRAAAAAAAASAAGDEAAAGAAPVMQRRGVPPAGCARNALIRSGVVELTRCALAACAAAAGALGAAADRTVGMLGGCCGTAPARGGGDVGGPGWPSVAAMAPSWSDCGRRRRKRPCTVCSCSRSRSIEIAPG